MVHARHQCKLRAVKIPDGMRVLFEGKVEMMREIAAQLEAAGIRSVSGPSGGGGWETRVWLAVASPDMQKAMAVHKDHLDRMVEREGLPLRDTVADLDAEETECPACLTKFKTAGTTRCPECGLNFAGR